MQKFFGDGNIRTKTASGIWASISLADIWSTIIMATVGAVVSIAVSMVLKRLTDHHPPK